MEGEYHPWDSELTLCFILGSERQGGVGKEKEGGAGKSEGGKALQPWHGPSQKGDK